MHVDRDIINLLCTLAEEEKLKVTVKESFRGAVVTGSSAFLGGLVLGPIGLAIGGAVGGCIATYLSHGKFKSAAEVIYNMNREQKERLVAAIKQIMENMDIRDVAILAASVASDLSIRRLVLEGMVSCLRDDMYLQIL